MSKVEMDEERSSVSLPQAVGRWRMKWTAARGERDLIALGIIPKLYEVRLFFTAGGPGYHSRGKLYLSQKQACETKGILPPPPPLSPQYRRQVRLGGCSRMSRRLGNLNWVIRITAKAHGRSPDRSAGN